MDGITDLMEAEVSKFVEEGRFLENVSKISFFKIIVHSERHYHVCFVNEIRFVPSCRHYD